MVENELAKILFESESYHRNGQVKEKYIQDYVYASSACLGAIEWDSLGHKTKEYQYDYKAPHTNTVNNLTLESNL